MGFNQRTINSIINLDFNGKTFIKTPYAVAAWMKATNSAPSHMAEMQSRLIRVQSFTPAQGVGQGDGPSPSIFNGFIDIILTAMDHMNIDDMIMANGAVINTKAFADDISSPKGSMAALQGEANLMASFAWITQLNFNEGKLRVFQCGRSEEAPTLALLRPNGTQLNMALQTTGTVTYLGYKHDIGRGKKGNTSIQTAMTFLRTSTAKLKLRHRHFSKDASF